MARKNARVRRANVRGEYRNHPVNVVQTPRIPLEAIVMPDGTCTMGNPRHPKAKFETLDKARKALAQAQRKRAATGTGHVEKRVYACPEGGCGGWHLTSRETYIPRGQA